MWILEVIFFYLFYQQYMFITFVGLQDNFELYLTTYLSLRSYFERRKWRSVLLYLYPEAKKTWAIIEL